MAQRHFELIGAPFWAATTHCCWPAQTPTLAACRAFGFAVFGSQASGAAAAS